MKNLQKLIARGDCGIDQKGISELDLVELDISFNEKIINVSFMKNLQKLIARGDCGIDQNGINELNLIKLDVSNNEKFKNNLFVKNFKKKAHKRLMGEYNDSCECLL